MKDHVHMLLSIPPKYSVSYIVGFMKGKSTLAAVLLHRGADATLRCHKSSGKFMTMIQSKGATPADLARNAGHEELANKLQIAKNKQQGHPDGK